MILDQIVEDKKKRLPEQKARISETEMRRLAEQTDTRAANSFYENLKKPGLSIIGEFKNGFPPVLAGSLSRIDLMVTH